MTKPKTPAAKLTFVQRRVLGAVLDLFDGGSVAVTVSDVFTRLASDRSASPIAEAEIRRQLEGMPECVTRVRPEIVITDAAWASMRRQPAPVAAREPSTPIAEAVTAQPVPIAPPPVAPVLREPPKTPVRKPSAPLSLDTVKVAERPKSDVTILAPAPEVDPEAVKRALAMEAAPAPAPAVDPGSRNDPAFVAALDEVLESAGPMLARLKDDAPRAPTDRPAVFPRHDRETLTELALRYLRARRHAGATAAEAQADTGWDLVTTLCDITRRGRAVGLGNGSRHNGKNAIKDPPRRRWWAAEFAPEGVVPEVRIGKKAVADAEQLADVQAERDRLRQQLRDFNDAHADDVALMQSALGVAGSATWGEILTFASEVVKERDRYQKEHTDATNALNAISYALGFTFTGTLVPQGLIDFARDLARDFRDLSSDANHALSVLASNLPKATTSLEDGNEDTGPLSTGDELVALANAAANVLAECSITELKCADLSPDEIAKVNAEFKRAIEDGSLRNTVTLMPESGIEAFERALTEARKTVVGDLARALNVQVEHTDASDAYFWLLDVARKRVPLDVGITNLIADETSKHTARIEALRMARFLAGSST